MTQTATEQRIIKDTDIAAARRTADVILHMLRDYIPTVINRQAHEHITRQSLDFGLEMTTVLQRKQYETLMNLTIAGGMLGASPEQSSGEK